MANISITTSCNRRCRYCFADPLPSRNSLLREHFGRVLDLLERSGIRQVRLLGGEPTLHPDFAALVKEAVDRDFSLLVFSNGLMPDPSLQALANLPEERCGVVLNVRCPPEDERAEPASLFHTCAVLGARASLGVNIDRTGLPLACAMDLIERFRLRRSLRLGLAHPRLGGNNGFLHPRFYPVVGQELLGVAREARRRGIELDLDCGFVRCMFPAEFFAETGLAAAEVGRRCGPIPDILPDLSSVYCYALGGQGRYPISGVETTAELIRLHVEWTADALRLGVYRECSACQWKQSQQCHGGCLAAALRRLHRGGEGRRTIARFDPRGVRPVGSPSVDRGQHPWLLPYIDQPAEFWRELSHAHPSRIKGVYFPLPDAPCGSGRPLQPHRHMEAFLTQTAVDKHVLINPLVLPGPIGENGPPIVDRMAQLVEEYGVTGATIADLRLAEMIRRRLPQLELTASVVMDIHQPHQALMLEGLCDVLVPATRIVRSLRRLQDLRRAFAGRLRLLVNEACLPGCPFRSQHFFEMATAVEPPESLCGDLLARQPWLRLLGAWVLPQHLTWFDDLVDEYKVAGRVTLREPADYRRVCDAYVQRTALWPHEIGGGPASVLDRWMVPDDLYAETLVCEQQCHRCDLCRRFAARHSSLRPVTAPPDLRPAPTDELRTEAAADVG